jgi:hypothetical protein
MAVGKEPVADGSDGADERWVVGVVPEGFAKRANMDVDHPLVPVVVLSPGGVKQLKASEHVPGVAGQCEEEVEVQGGESDWSVGADDLAS